MQVDTGAVSKGIREAQARITGFAAEIQSIGSGIGAIPALVAGGALGAVGAAIGKVISLGSDLNETVSKLGVVFGSQASIVTDAADEMAAKYGVVKTSFMDAAAGIGQIAKASGLNKTAAAEMGAGFSKLAADISSITNTPLPEVLGSIKSGLVGEAEPLRKYGVLLSEAAVSQRAVSMGLVRYGHDMNEATKVQARAAIITEQLGYGLGDLERTQLGVANASRNLAGRIENLAAELGLALQPLAETGLALLNTALGTVGDNFDGLKEKVRDWAVQGASSIGFVVESFRGVGSAIGAVLDAYQAWQIGNRAIANGAKWLWGIFQQGIGELIGSLDRLYKSMGLDLELDKIQQAISESSRKTFGEVDAEWKKLLSDFSQKPSDGINQWFDGVIGKTNEAIAKFKDLADAPQPGWDLNKTHGDQRTPEDFKKLADQQKQMGEKAKSIWESTLSPIDQLALKLKEINDLQKEGYLDAEQANKARQAAAKDLVEKSVNRSIGAADYGSKEAYSAIVQYQRGQDDPLKSLPDLTKQGNDIALRQTEILARIEARAGGPISPITGTVEDGVIRLNN